MGFLRYLFLNTFGFVLLVCSYCLQSNGPPGGWTVVTAKEHLVENVTVSCCWKLCVILTPPQSLISLALYPGLVNLTAWFSCGTADATTSRHKGLHIWSQVPVERETPPLKPETYEHLVSFSDPTLSKASWISWASTCFCNSVTYNVQDNPLKKKRYRYSNGDQQILLL